MWSLNTLIKSSDNSDWMIDVLKQNTHVLETYNVAIFHFHSILLSNQHTLIKTMSGPFDVISAFINIDKTISK